MKRTFSILPLLFAIIVVSCTHETPQEPSMIVEAYIDANGYPTVLLHKSYVLDNIPDSVQTLEEIAEQQLIMWGKVTISDGENEVILTGRLDTLYLPPYTYSTLNMVGEVGKTYTLTATYKQMTATATTTIPPIATFDSIRVFSNEGNKHILAYVSNPPTTEPAYYAMFMRYKGDKQYLLCPFGVFDNSKMHNDLLEVMVYNPFGNDTNLEYDFDKADTAHIYQLKLARLDYESYRYWNDYVSMATTKGIFFVPIYENLHGNVSGGIGNFTGMGSTIYNLSITNNKTYIYCNTN